MALANDNKRWPGNQPDATFSTGEHTLKPIPQPPCDLSSQHQFADESEYIQVKRDRWGNEVPVDWSNHREGTSGTGSFGDMQFSSNAQDRASTGYDDNRDGIVEIPYGQGPGFARAETIYIGVDRADRGKSE